MATGSSRPRGRVVAVALALLAAAGAAFHWLAPLRPDPAEPPQATADVAAAPPVAAPAPGPVGAEPPAEEESGPTREPRPPELLEADPETHFESIDLEAAREALPDNLYWEHAAPTQDPRLLGDRERAKTYWNEQYGKVLSGTGTEEEVRAYYDHRMRMSSDYVRFVDWVLEHQGDSLSDQDLGLLHLARRLHLARLQEVPRKLQEALDRKAQQDAAREAWLAEQREFESAEETEEAPADSE